VLVLIGGLAAIAGSFLIGRATAAEQADGDVFRAKAVAMQCLAAQEGGAPSVICSHVPGARYSVVFFRDNLFVYRNGEPDRPVFSAEGEP
jgi:hypothetical protein